MTEGLYSHAPNNLGKTPLDLARLLEFEDGIAVLTSGVRRPAATPFWGAGLQQGAGAQAARAGGEAPSTIRVSINPAL